MDEWLLSLCHIIHIVSHRKQLFRTSRLFSLHLTSMMMVAMHKEWSNDGTLGGHVIECSVHVQWLIATLKSFNTTFVVVGMNHSIDSFNL